MNQGKLEVVKQEMIRVNIDILGNNELKCMGTGKFNSEGHIYYYGQEYLRRSGIALIVKKSPKCRTWCSLKNDRIILVHFQGKCQYQSRSSLSPKGWCWRSWIWWFYEDLLDLLELTPTQDVLFIIVDWNAEVGNQEISGDTGKLGLGVQNEARQRLREFCQENTLVIANTLFQPHKIWLYTVITRWSILKSDWLYSLLSKMEKLYTVSKNKTGSWLWFRSWTPYCQF